MLAFLRTVFTRFFMRRQPHTQKKQSVFCVPRGLHKPKKAKPINDFAFLTYPVAAHSKRWKESQTIR